MDILHSLIIDNTRRFSALLLILLLGGLSLTWSGCSSTISVSGDGDSTSSFGIDGDQGSGSGGGGDNDDDDGPILNLDSDLNLEPGTVVGELGLEKIDNVPNNKFFLAGTMPVPANMYPRDDGAIPFKVIDANGDAIKAQVEIVSRYPNDNDGAAVVEIIAPVSTKPQDPMNYKIVFDKHKDLTRPEKLLARDLPDHMSLPPNLVNLLTQPLSLVLAIYGADGTVYNADLLGPEARVLKYGRYEIVLATYSITTDIGGSGKRGLGVHAYMTFRQDSPTVSIKLRVSNAHTFEALPDFYFNSIVLGVSSGAGWKLHEKFKSVHFRPCTTDGGINNYPCSVTGYDIFPIVDRLRNIDTRIVYKFQKNPDGSIVLDDNNQPVVIPNYTIFANENQHHVMHQQAQFVRNLTLTPESESAVSHIVQGKTRAFARQGKNQDNEPYYSWWNRQTPNLLAQRVVMPSYSDKIRQKLRDKFSGDLFEFSESRRCNVQSRIKVDANCNIVQTNGGELTKFQSAGTGWGTPYGADYGGATSGLDIYTFSHIAEVINVSSWVAMNFMGIFYQSVVDRKPNALYNADGTSIRIEDWRSNSANNIKSFNYNYYNGYKKGGPDPHGIRDAQQNHTPPPPQNQPGYKHDLTKYDPFDWQHYVRYHPIFVLVWLANDVLAKEELIQDAELARLFLRMEPSHANTLNGTSSSAPLIGKQIDVYNLSESATIGDASAGLPVDEEGLIDVSQLPKYGSNFEPSGLRGKGFDWGRDEGHASSVAAQAYAVAPTEWRDKRYKWIKSIAMTMHDGQSVCSGFFQKTVYHKTLNGDHFVTQSFEEAFNHNSLQALAQSVFYGKDDEMYMRMRKTLERGTRGLTSPRNWDEAAGKPYLQIALAPFKQFNPEGPYYYYFDEPIPPYLQGLCVDGEPESAIHDGFNIWVTMAFGFNVTQDNFFLRRAADILGVNNPYALDNQTLYDEMLEAMLPEDEFLFKKEIPDLPVRTPLIGVVQDQAGLLE